MFCIFAKKEMGKLHKKMYFGQSICLFCRIYWFSYFPHIVSVVIKSVHKVELFPSVKVLFTISIRGWVTITLSFNFQTTNYPFVLSMKFRSGKSCSGMKFLFVFSVYQCMSVNSAKRKEVTSCHQKQHFYHTFLKTTLSSFVSADAGLHCFPVHTSL